MQGNIKERRKRVMKRSIFIVLAFVMVLSMILTSCNVDELTLPEELVPSTEAPTDGMYDEEEPTEELNCEEQGDEEDSDDDSQSQDEDNDQGNQPRPTPTRTPMPTRTPTSATPSPTPQNTPTRTPTPAIPTPTPKVSGSIPFSYRHFRGSYRGNSDIIIPPPTSQIVVRSMLVTSHTQLTSNFNIPRNHLERYDDDFFRENAVIVAYRWEGDWDISYQVTSLIRRDNELYFRFNRQGYFSHRTPSHWLILIEVSQSDVVGVERISYSMKNLPFNSY